MRRFIPVLADAQVDTQGCAFSAGQPQPAGGSSRCLGIPGRIVEITDCERKLAKVEISGIKREINLACIVDDEHPLQSCVGEWVIVHVGFALSRIDEAEAAATLRLLDEIGEIEAQLETPQ